MNPNGVVRSMRHPWDAPASLKPLLVKSVMGVAPEREGESDPCFSVAETITILPPLASIKPLAFATAATSLEKNLYRIFHKGELLCLSLHFRLRPAVPARGWHSRIGVRPSRREDQHG
jgi:hypothetical protein